MASSFFSFTTIDSYCANFALNNKRSNSNKLPGSSQRAALRQHQRTSVATTTVYCTLFVFISVLSMALSTPTGMNNGFDDRAEQQQQRIGGGQLSEGNDAGRTMMQEAGTVISVNNGAAENVFREYLSRGMFTCAAKYVSVLQKLNKLVANAHQEYTQCQDQIAQAGRPNAEQSRKLAAQLEMINEMFRDE